MDFLVSCRCVFASVSIVLVDIYYSVKINQYCMHEQFLWLLQMITRFINGNYR